jgi:hypothetical protein
VPSSAKRLLVGSTESYSGKTAAVLGIGLQLKALGIDLAFGKPMGSPVRGDEVDPDLDFVLQTLGLGEDRYFPPTVSLSETVVANWLKSGEILTCTGQLNSFTETKGESLLLLEGPGNLNEGKLVSLDLPQMVDAIDAKVLLVTRYDSLLLVERLLTAKAELGEHLLGVIVNDLPEEAIEQFKQLAVPFLEQNHIPVLATLPRSPLMRSISVRDIVGRLNADVLCCGDRLDLMVETLTIGAMNVNSALRYFRKGINMAVVTGGDRADIQLAALETATQCLVLTGQIPPSREILERAKDLEVPILAVDSDTLSTVERIDELFGQARLHEPVKVKCLEELFADHFDIDRLLQLLDLKVPVAT